MDYDGFMLLMERDFEKFTNWEKKSKKMSLEQLRKNHNEWHQKMIDVKEKYGFSNKPAEKEDISIFMVKTVYFYYLAMIGWFTLRAYTDKLREENKELRKSPSKTRKKKKPRSTVSKT